MLCVVGQRLCGGFNGRVSVCFVSFSYSLCACVLFSMGIGASCFVGTGSSLQHFLSNVVCLYEDPFGWVFQWGTTHGVGNAMVLRVSACAAELCSMRGIVFCGVSIVCGVPC